MQAFVPKNRRPKFDLVLRIIDLNNVPLVSGTSVIKWHLPHSAAAEHRGRTSKCNIRDHKVEFDYEKSVSVRLTVDRTNMLQALDIHFEVLQEYAGARGERIQLGKVKLNLAEYVDSSEVDGDEGIVRRYLMQDSKVNSTIKIGINMRLVEGERNFIAPPLKTAPVFGGIAGIIVGEQGETEEPGQGVAPLTNKSREVGEVQDMYRRTLAAFWTAQPGELRAHECIEDIFNGGDGWGKKDQGGQDPDRAASDNGSRSFDFPEIKPRHYHSRSSSKETFKAGGGSRQSNHRTSLTGSVSGRASLEQHANSMKAAASTNPVTHQLEIDEFNVREDLRSWKIGTRT